MPVILGVQYPDVPNEVSIGGNIPCGGMDAFMSTTSGWYLDAYYAANTTPLSNKILNQFAALGVDVVSRDIDEDLSLTDMLEASAQYDFYIQSWLDWFVPLLEHISELLESNMPETGFGYWYADTFGFTLNFSNEDDGGFIEGLDLSQYPTCGFWKNKIENDLLPNIDLIRSRLFAAKGYFDFVHSSIQAYQEQLVDTISLQNDIQEGYGYHLDMVAENEDKERKILQARFLDNVSQFSMVGAIALLGVSQTKLLK